MGIRWNRNRVFLKSPLGSPFLRPLGQTRRQALKRCLPNSLSCKLLAARNTWYTDFFWKPSPLTVATPVQHTLRSRWSPTFRRQAYTVMQSTEYSGDRRYNIGAERPLFLVTAFLSRRTKWTIIAGTSLWRRFVSLEVFLISPVRRTSNHDRPISASTIETSASTGFWKTASTAANASIRLSPVRIRILSQFASPVDAAR